MLDDKKGFPTNKKVIFLDYSFIKIFNIIIGTALSNSQLHKLIKDISY